MPDLSSKLTTVKVVFISLRQGKKSVGIIVICFPMKYVNEDVKTKNDSLRQQSDDRHLDT